METIERKIERTRPLPAGPWDDEPDKVQWPDEATGLACLAKRGPLGAWCGYVGVDETHPWFGLDYDDVEADPHGGLTYAALCDGDEEQGICHVPGEGEPDPLWWFGFDCAHGFDVVPGMLEFDRNLGEHLGVPVAYRDLGYVKAEVAHLARTIAIVR